MKIARQASGQESRVSIAAAGQQFHTDHGTSCHGGRNETMSRRCGIACTVGAFVVATLLLLSDQLDESIASPAKANETNELQQLFLIMAEESTVLAYPSQ